ncbi:MAG: hypothetical protein WDN27_05995 [Candidatus Saccharibacteria bacterium]
MVLLIDGSRQSLPLDAVVLSVGSVEVNALTAGMFSELPSA